MLTRAFERYLELVEGNVVDDKRTSFYERNIIEYFIQVSLESRNEGLDRLSPGQYNRTEFSAARFPVARGFIDPRIRVKRERRYSPGD